MGKRFDTKPEVNDSQSFLKQRDCLIVAKAFRVAGRLHYGEGACFFFVRQYRQIWNLSAVPVVESGVKLNYIGHPSAG